MRVIYSLKWMVCSVLLFVVLFWMGATGAKAYDYAENMATGGVPSDEYCTNLELGSNNFLDFEKTGDVRAYAFSNYIAYGTDDEMEIWLQKYGFELEDIEWLKPCIDSISEEEIVFNDLIYNEIEEEGKLEAVKRYLNEE